MKTMDESVKGGACRAKLCFSCMKSEPISHSIFCKCFDFENEVTGALGLSPTW